MTITPTETDAYICHNCVRVIENNDDSGIESDTRNVNLERLGLFTLELHPDDHDDPDEREPYFIAGAMNACHVCEAEGFDGYRATFHHDAPELIGQVTA